MCRVDFVVHFKTLWHFAEGGAEKSGQCDAIEVVAYLVFHLVTYAGLT